MLMYLTVMSSAPQLLNSVIEEKMSRISEVLIGSVTPFQLMMGKLIGGAASRCCWLRSISPAVSPSRTTGRLRETPSRRRILAWFLLFLVMAVFMFGSLFIAIGAACSDLKDSQNMMTPVMLLVMLPVFTAATVLRAPDGMMSTVLSMIPTATPFLMMLRISLQPGPPAWQIALSVVLMAATVAVTSGPPARSSGPAFSCRASRPRFAEMFRWVRAR